MAGKVGILQNMKTHYKTGLKFDGRSTAEVETTRDPTNKKPSRSKEQKVQARAEAFIPKTGKFKGTWISYVPRN